MGWRRGKFSLAALLAQGAFLVLFILFVRYDPVKGKDGKDGDKLKYYPVFQDVHVMLFIGFGFLATFLKRYGFGSVTFNFLICAFVIQWATIMGGLIRLKADDWTINVSIKTMMLSDMACVAVIISFGALLGKASPLQLLIVAACEVVVYNVNEWICDSRYMAADSGRSMFVHVFGAYFGLTVSRVINDNAIYQSPARNKTGSHYHSDIFAMIGTLFLWVFWPSFNSGLSSDDDAAHRAILNTYFSLASSTIASFCLSAVLDEDDKFDMNSNIKLTSRFLLPDINQSVMVKNLDATHLVFFPFQTGLYQVYVQNAALAGGVGIGTMAGMVIHPWGAMLVGIVSGLISVVGIRYITPFFSNMLRIHDSRDVHSLHGLPGLVAAVGGIIAAALATEEVYGTSLYDVFPGRAPASNSSDFFRIQSALGDSYTLNAGHGWSAGRQAGMQAAALVTTILFALVGGLATGIIIRIPVWDQPQEEEIFEDEPWFKLPDEGYPSVYVSSDNEDQTQGDSQALMQSESPEN